MAICTNSWGLLSQYLWSNSRWLYMFFRELCIILAYEYSDWQTEFSMNSFHTIEYVGIFRLPGAAIYAATHILDFKISTATMSKLW